MAAASSTVSRSVCASASTIEPMQGCDVPPENESIAASTASTPASAAASTLTSGLYNPEEAGSKLAELDKLVPQVTAALQPKASAAADQSYDAQDSRHLHRA